MATKNISMTAAKVKYFPVRSCLPRISYHTIRPWVYKIILISQCYVVEGGRSCRVSAPARGTRTYYPVVEHSLTSHKSFFFSCIKRSAAGPPLLPRVGNSASPGSTSYAPETPGLVAQTCAYPVLGAAAIPSMSRLGRDLSYLTSTVVVQVVVVTTSSRLL